jgi:hypothetical protein
MKFPSVANFSSHTVFDGKQQPVTAKDLTTAIIQNQVTNRSVAKTIFGNDYLSNAQITAKERKKRALKALAESSPSLSFTGKNHPLSEDAEYKTEVATQLDTSDAHVAAAEAHDKATAKMAQFMGETGPLQSKDHKFHMAGLKTHHSHHRDRAKLHREIAGVLASEEYKKQPKEEDDEDTDNSKKGKRKIVNGVEHSPQNSDKV